MTEPKEVWHRHLGAYGVVQAVEWIKQGQLPVESKRLDDWVVISS